MTELHDLLSDLADLAPTTLERDVTRGRSLHRPLAVAAALLLVAGGVAVVIDGPLDSRRTVVVDEPTPTPTPTVTTSAPPTKESAEAECSHQITRVLPPPDAVEHDTPPGQYLTTDTIAPSGDFAASTRFWVTHLSLDDALAYMQDHQPDGVSPFGGSSTNSQNGVIHTKSLIEGLYGQALMQVTMEPLADGTTGIRADAQCTYGTNAVSSSGGNGVPHSQPVGGETNSTGGTTSTTGG